MTKTRLVVLFGGQSAEHEVSCISAMHVLQAADPDAYRVVPIGITREGRWVESADAVATLGAGASALPSPDDSDGAELDPLPAILPADADEGQVVVLPLLHGPMGEDGTVQGLLELAGVPYVGAGVLASSLCMDKSAAKDMLLRYDLPQPHWMTAREHELTGQETAFADRVVLELGLPVFVKPANLGSSVGVAKAHDVEELRAAIADALRYDDRIVVEEAIVGREIEVAVLGNNEPRASLPGEIVPGGEFYDFDDKYVDAVADLRVPAPLSSAETEDVRGLAVRAYRALRVDGMARVDFFFETDGKQRGFLVNELNTIPGFTPISMYPKLWEASGLSYAELIDELVRLAIERHDRRSRFETKR